MSTSLGRTTTVLAPAGNTFLAYVNLTGIVVHQFEPGEPLSFQDIIDLLAASHARLDFYRNKPEESAGVFRGVASMGPLPMLVVQTRVDLAATGGISPHHAVLLYNSLRTSGQIVQPALEAEGR